MGKHYFITIVNSNIVQILNFYFIIDNIILRHIRYALVERERKRDKERVVIGTM